MNEPPLVRIAANCVRRMIYQYRDDMLAGMIVAGWDKKLGGQVSRKCNPMKSYQSFLLFRCTHVPSVACLFDSPLHSVVQVVPIFVVISTTTIVHT